MALADRDGPGTLHLTTAAGLWCVAAIGLGAGLGMYVITVTATVLACASKGPW